MCKRLICVVLAFIVLVCSAFINASAVAELCFELEDVNAKAGRLFETTLKATGQDNLAAFVISLEYDADSVAFRKAKSSADNAIISVNSDVDGVVTIAFLCEDGVNVNNGADVLSFTFKALKSTELCFTVTQAIDADAADLTVTDCKSATVDVADGKTASTKADKTADKTVESKPDTAADTAESTTVFYDASEHSNYMDLKPDSRDYTYIFCAVGVGILILAVAATSFVLGRKSNNKKSEAYNEKDS